MAHIFISYSKKDHDYVRKLAKHILTQGFDVWIDEEIGPSDEWWKKIVEAVRSCSAFIVIMTPDSGTSRWVEREVMLADELSKPIFPLLLSGDLHTSDVWALFIGKQYEDARLGDLPNSKFYQRLELIVPRKPTSGVEVKTSVSISVPPLIMKSELFNPIVNTEPLIGVPNITMILPPPFEWCEVSEGKVTLEYGANSYSGTGFETFIVSRFLIAKYPIVNSQYQVFLDAEDGYVNTNWWAFSEEALNWRKTTSQPENTLVEQEDLPRVNVSWYEAIAFCRWLTQQLVGQGFNEQEVITLPSEQQWQRSAQGNDSRIYPWGNRFNFEYCNSAESRIRNRTPVTRFPSGVSPFGVMGMSGNCWEWCLSTWLSDQIDLKGDQRRSIRGGSWVSSQADITTMSRNAFSPHIRNFDLGFRVAFNFK